MKRHKISKSLLTGRKVKQNQITDTETSFTVPQLTLRTPAKNIMHSIEFQFYWLLLHHGTTVDRVYAITPCNVHDLYIQGDFATAQTYQFLKASGYHLWPQAQVTLVDENNHLATVYLEYWLHYLKNYRDPNYEEGNVAWDYYRVTIWIQRNLHNLMYRLPVDIEFEGRQYLPGTLAHITGEIHKWLRYFALRQSISLRDTSKGSQYLENLIDVFHDFGMDI